MPNPLFDALLAPHRENEATFLSNPDGSALSYAMFFQRVMKVSNALKLCGLKPGDRLALQVEKSVEALEIYGACIASGVIFLPLNTAYTVDEVSYFLGDARPGVFICDPPREAEFFASDAINVDTIHTLSVDGTGSFSDLVAKQTSAFAPADREAEDIAALLYTSGTTGRSKGAMLTQNNLLSNAEVLIDLWRITAQDTLLHALPIFHAHGLFVAVNTTLMAGGAMIFLPGFRADTVIEKLPHATTMMGVPTFYTRLLDDARFDAELVANMRLFISGSAPLLAETHEVFEARTGHRILERYGMTETSMNTSNPYDGERRAGTVGFPLPGVDVRIVEDGGDKAVPAGEIGMVEVRGPNVFKGYWNMPEKTAEELRENGFLITGDLGRIDGDGYLHIVGRNKDLIISGGYNVYPKEVELVLDDLPGVLESAVVGAPHPDFGEGVVAVLVALPGAAIDMGQIRTATASKLAKYKQPKEVIVIDTLPRNTMGKVQKNVLRDTYSNLFTAR
ncbi:MAG: malonyl-CoA synthase [Sulfitobacter sp.]